MRHRLPLWRRRRCSKQMRGHSSKARPRARLCAAEKRGRASPRAWCASSVDSLRLSARCSPSGRRWPDGAMVFGTKAPTAPVAGPVPGTGVAATMSGAGGAPQRCRQRCGPSAAGAPVRSRGAQRCRPARAARLVLLTRRDCPSAARAASVASFAARPAPRAPQGTPAQRGPAPARPRRAARAFARAIISKVARADSSARRYNGRFSQCAISPTTPRRNASTQTTKIAPCTTVTQAPIWAR